MSYAAGVFLGVLACVVIIMALLQLHEYLRGRSLLSRRHLALRLAVALLLLVDVVAIFVGVLVKFPGPWHGLAYWSAVLALLLVVTALAVIDLRMLERVKHQRRAELFRRLAEIEERLRRAAEDNE